MGSQENKVVLQELEQLISSADEAVTTLHTPLMGQPALVGLVNRLNGLGLRILLVEQAPFEEERNKENNP